jgi:hypothetical protein
VKLLHLVNSLDFPFRLRASLGAEPLCPLLFRLPFHQTHETRKAGNTRTVQRLLHRNARANFVVALSWIGKCQLEPEEYVPAFSLITGASARADDLLKTRAVTLCGGKSDENGHRETAWSAHRLG